MTAKVIPFAAEPIRSISLPRRRKRLSTWERAVKTKKSVQTFNKSLLASCLILNSACIAVSLFIVFVVTFF